MTEQEFRKLKQLDLIQILLTQGNEVTLQQGELDRKSERLGLLLEENDIIKLKLNDRDAMTEMIKQKLNESDDRIRELEEETKKLYADRRIELEEAGSLVQAALELNKIFEAAQKEAEQYIQNGEQRVERLAFDEVSVSTDHSEADYSEVVPEQPEVVAEQSELEPEKPEIVAEQIEPEQPKVVAEQIEPEQPEPEPEQPEVVAEQTEPEPEQLEIVAEQTQPESEQPEVVAEQSEVEPKHPDLIFSQQADHTVIEECSDKGEASPVNAFSEEETPARQREEKLTKEEKPAEEEKPTEEEAPAVVSGSKPAKEPGQEKSGGLLRFFLKWKK